MSELAPYQQVSSGTGRVVTLREQLLGKHPMELDSIGQVIAERRLTLDGNHIAVRLGMPQRFPDNPEHYYCAFEIEGLGGLQRRYAGGLDSLQALRLALKMIGTILHCHRQELEGDDLGFPDEA